MPVVVDFSLAKHEDGVLLVRMSPPVNVGGQTLRFSVSRRHGSDAPFLVKFAASGYGGGQSGVTVTDSGLGAFGVQLYGSEFSGKDPQNYAYKVERMDSGSRTQYTVGYLLLGPG